MTATITTQIAAIRSRIATLEATPDALVGCDEGTHGTPANHRIYETINGDRYGIRSFSGANGTRISEMDAGRMTVGIIRPFPISQGEIRDQASELKRLRKELRKLEK